ncbi:MAG TPA: O-antigen ligase family protein [Hanamia sp.]|nr:O-antigen ligase family protein [Hanamia sp.]
MFIEKTETRLHALIKDPVARLLFLNGFFVIFAYAAYNLTGGAATGAVRIFKNIFLFISLAYLIVTNRIINPGRIFDSGFVPVVFGVLIFYVSIGTGDVLVSFGRSLTFFVPFIYVYLSLTYLIANFGIQLFLKGFHYGVLIIYCIPLITYILSGGKITDANIYGPGGESQMFSSNGYGWSATLYMLAILFVWKDVKLTKISKIFFGVFLPVAIVLFFTSANRTSWLSMAFAMIPFFFSYKAMHLKYKISIALIMLGFISVLLADPNSSLNYAKSKSDKQEQVGEARFIVAGIGRDYFNKEPTLWLTGVGMFNFEPILKNKSNLANFHNSYYDILFGAGIPLFLLFLSFMVFKPIIRYIKYYSRYTLLIAPLMIIPFFESDLTGGQFLFFPWFTFMLLLNAKTKFWNKETFNASIKKRKIIADLDSVDIVADNPVL